jgi:hypothetical protein
MDRTYLQEYLVGESAGHRGEGHTGGGKLPVDRLSEPCQFVNSYKLGFYKALWLFSADLSTIFY